MNLIIAAERTMKFSTPDLVILAGYLIGVTLFGAWLGKKQKNATDYFLGGRNLPWPAVCFSVIATETSTLTFISIPGLAYLTNLSFMQMTFGYLLGRILISVMLLPGYYRGEIKTAYEVIGNRFGSRLRSFTAIVFQLTRLLADGVRLFATAIPLAMITGWDYSVSILVMALLTIVYTFVGGIRAVVWMDVVQLFVYLGGAVLVLFTALSHLPDGWLSVWQACQPADKLHMLVFGLDMNVRDFFSTNYTLPSGLIGGAFLSMASHGTDHLMVQRLLSCRNLRSSQKALIGSGVFVIFQFLLFLLLGLTLYAYYGGQAIRSDEVLPKFIAEGLPTGAAGLIIAGIFAAAMSTLSGSLNSLASSTLFDIVKPRWRNNKISDHQELVLSKLFTLLWGLVFIGGAMLFKDDKNPVVELGLAIASFTYGGMLGVFFLGTYSNKIREADALVALWSAILFMTWIIGVQGVQAWIMVLLNLAAAVWIWRQVQLSGHRIFVVVFSAAMITLIFSLPAIRFSWPWYTLIGYLICTLVGKTLSMNKKSR